MCGFPKIKVKELGKIITGKTPRTSNKSFYGGEIPFLTPSDDMSAKFVHITSRTLTESGVDSVKNCKLPSNSICVSCIGSDLGKVTITKRDTVTNQQINSIVVDTSLYDLDYVYYCLKILGKELNYISKTSTAVPIVNKTQFGEYEIPNPPRETQIKIGKLLSVIDNKIDLNNQINKNLANQAQVIYCDMFIANANHLWRIGHLSDLVTIRYGKDHKKLADGSYPVYGSGGIMRYVERPLYDKESVLIPRKGTLNNVMYVNEPFWSVDTMFFTEMKLPNVAKFVFHFVNSKDLTSLNSGSAVPSMTTEILNTMELSIPDADTLAKFECIVDPMYKTMQQNEKESSKLAELRDSLLPRLMSGEIDVSDLNL